MKMAHPYHHAVSTAKRHGGAPEYYLAIYTWFDESKAYIADVRHRVLRHHAEGIFMAEKIFGVTVTNSVEREIPFRFIGEQPGGPGLDSGGSGLVAEVTTAKTLCCTIEQTS